MNDIPAELQPVADALAPFNMELTAMWADDSGVWGQLMYAPFDGYLKGFPVGPCDTGDELTNLIIATAEQCQAQDGEYAMNIFSTPMFEYLSAETLAGGSLPGELTIKSVTVDQISGPRGTDDKVVVYFRETPKKLILNKTNARAIADRLGPETNDWTGARVAFRTERVKVGRNDVDAIRVGKITAASNGKPAQVSKPAAAPQPAPEPALFDEAQYGNGDAVTEKAMTFYDLYVAETGDAPENRDVLAAWAKNRKTTTATAEQPALVEVKGSGAYAE